MPARITALKTLMQCRMADAWSDAALGEAIEQAKLSRKDAALATTICYGVLQNQALLDYYIDGFLTGRKHLQPALRDILRVAVYQILFLDRIPDSAAVNEAVKQAKKQFSTRESGLVNGVLRNLVRNKAQLCPPRDYHIRYSHPSELVDLMKESVGKKLEMILAADNATPETSVVCNSLKTTSQKLQSVLEAEGVSVMPHPWLSGGFLLKGTGNLEELDSFQNGLFQVQDAAARLSVDVLKLKPGMKVLDLCAAPGGKSMAAGMYLGNQGSILSCDLHGGKLPQIEGAARRLGVTIVKTMEHDASGFTPEFSGQFDAVIADVPCSGLGVIRKKPDIRYKDLKPLEALPALQLEILTQAAKYVRLGGDLIYSTCTILKRENEAVVHAFLKDHPEFVTVPLELPEQLREQEPGMLTLYQGIDHCDGFFLCHMRKKP